jgi:chromosome segregation protein
MRIKRIEIKGFKSFPDKSILQFQPGITAVVGPNGCGKSNILEAIRWVMGEQRVKSLRGKKMEDVIFNGSDSRKPVGMAEVRLVLSNTDGQGSANMADYDEIMISRRLFRDGESQYEINNIPCRLTDITDFFLDTGVGKNSYAIIEQGKVDTVVASKPEDRRVLIEEAAGIARYKARREAALRKLEQTKQNLLRISDVIHEVKRQSASLKRQATRAERYRKLSTRLKELDLAFHAHKCTGLQERINELKGSLNKDQSLLAEQEAQQASLEARLESERLKALNGEKELTEVLESLHAVKVDLTEVRGHVERDRTRIAQLKDRAERAKEEKGYLEEQSQRALERLKGLEAEKAAVQTETDSAKLELEQIDKNAAGSREQLARQRELLDRLKDDLFRALQDTAQERNHRESLARTANEIGLKIDRINSEFSEAALALEHDIGQKEGFLKSIEETERLLSDESNRKEELVQTRQRTLNEIEASRRKCAGAEKNLAGHKARLESLEEMQSSYTAYDEGVRFLMKDQAFHHEGWLLGPLAEMMDVPEEFQRALAGALGERLGHLVVSSTLKGVEAAGRLEEAKAGRSTFIPMSPRSDPNGNSREAPEGLIRLSDVVHFRRGYEKLGDFLLGRFFVVDDMQRAVQIWEQNGIGVDLVTRRGEVLNRYGEITGGSREGASGEIFERRREIAALKENISGLVRDISAIEDSLDGLERESERLSTDIDAVDGRISELNMKNMKLGKDLERIEDLIKNSERKQEVLGLESERLEKESEEIFEQIWAAEEQIILLERKSRLLEQQRDKASGSVTQLTLAAQEESRRSGEIRVRVAKLEERGNSLHREITSANETAQQLGQQLSALEQETDRNTQEEKSLTDQMEHRAVKEKELMQQHESLAQKSERLKAVSVEIGASINKLEDQWGKTGKTVKDLREDVHTLEMESVRLEQTLEGLVEKILERYGEDPRAVPAPDTLPDEEEIAQLKKKIDAMGEVNLAAIAESQQTDERLHFLQEQEEDLNKAVDSLYATINKINKTTRERFKTAFHAINEKFQEIFPFLFRGGEARLELTDEDDLLETGVDIMARPPGKRIQNMRLLSGGEKALTAVALIFSIFLIRPSPFCLLDEVDAPLDDANLARFNDMLKRLADRTQFLLITHNKRSMERADTLYGVTMEEPGVSAVVSVEFMDRGAA